jgi:transketolase
MMGHAAAGIRREVRAPFAEALATLGEHRDDVVVLGADLSKYTDVRGFAETYPARFVQVGMAEQNLMGIAAGLAKTGFVPIVTTYCVFATRRAYDQVALSLATGTRNVVIVAFLPGITTPFRATHQGTDDLALMRQIPGMTVIDPADATELRAAVLAAVDLGGPVYIRGLRGVVPELFDPSTYRFGLDAVHPLREGADVGIIATGVGTSWALEAADELAARGRDAAVLHVPTLAPFPAAAVREFARDFEVVITVENHAAVGGVGSLVAELLAEKGARGRLVRIGIPHAWAPAGSTDHIRRELRLDPSGIADRIEAELDGGIR